MPKLIYLYTTGGACGDLIPYTNRCMFTPTTNRYARAAVHDGMVNLFSILPEHTTYIDSTEIFIDSAYENGYLKTGKLATLYVVPSIQHTLHHISPGDVVVIRGGFRNWLPLITKLHDKRENWILFYRANTAHGHWPYWHVTLNDLISTPTKSRHCAHIPFSKPVNESVFGYIDNANIIPEEYQFMIGASHIHKKKGQIYTIRALKEFHNLYGWSPKSIIPGGFIRCIHNQEIKEATDNPKLNIYAAGALQRPELALAMNRSRFFIHAGPGGQNDRGTLEAMACGCSPIIANSKSAAPFLSQVVHTVDNVNPIHLARYLYELLSLSLPVPRAQVVNEYQRYNGCLVQSIPQLKHLLKFISANPHPSHELAKEALS